MRHPLSLLVMLCVLGPGATAVAEDAEVRDVLHAALEEQLPVPAEPPTLPDQAADAARKAHEEKAFRRAGDAARRANAAARRELEREPPVELPAAPGAEQGARKKEARAADAAASRSRTHAAKRGGPPVKPEPPVHPPDRR